MATFVVLRYSVPTLITNFTNPYNLTNDLPILNPLVIENSPVKKSGKGVTFIVVLSINHVCPMDKATSYVFLYV